MLSEKVNSQPRNFERVLLKKNEIVSHRGIVFSGIRPFVEVWRKNFNTPWGIVFVLTFFLLLILPRFGIRIEDTQTLFFPVVLVSFWKFPRTSNFCFPIAFVILAFGCWGFSFLFTRAFVPNRLMSRAIYVSRLSDDQHEVETHRFQRQFHEVAKTHSFTGLSQLERTFRNELDALAWLSHHPQALMLLRGSPALLEVILPARGLTWENGATLDPDIPESLLQASRRAGIELSKDTIILQPRDLDVALAIAGTPELLRLPGPPPDQSWHFLVLLAKGFSVGSGTRGSPKIQDQTFALFQAKRWEEFVEASRLYSGWRFTSPRALAEFFLGTDQLLGSTRNSAEGAKEIQCALLNFRRGMRYARKKQDREILAALFNNAAVAQLLLAHTGSTEERDYRTARKWLLQAASIVNSSGKVVRGGKLAYLNLVMLERAGAW